MEERIIKLYSKINCGLMPDFVILHFTCLLCTLIKLFLLIYLSVCRSHDVEISDVVVNGKVVKDTEHVQGNLASK